MIVPAVLSLTAFAAVGASQSLNDSTTCDTTTCQPFVVRASTWETSQHASPDMSFYGVPSNFSSDLEPGVLLAVEDATDLTNYTVPGGLTMSRIIYTTELGSDGSTVPASAYILWPYVSTSAATASGSDPGCSSSDDLPLVAWAHGTTGLFPTCAPSNYRSLQYHFMAPWALALQGMAVVAPDYSGLGVGLPSRPDDPSPRHQWFGVSNSADIAHAITAARAAFPSLLSPTGPFTVMGHSEGGGAAWAFAERQVATPLAGYRGAVAIAPTTFLDDLEAAYGTVETDPQVELLGVVPLVIDAVTSYFPSYNWSSFTDKARDRYEHVLKPLRGCLPTENLAFGVDFQPTDFAGPGWLEADEVLEWSNLTAVGRKTFAGPLLVIGGERDGTVLIDTLKSAVDDTCDLVAADGDAESLEFAVYTGVSHFPAIQASQGRWMQWIKDRLAGKALKTKGGCTLETVEGLRTEFTAQSILPNFLVTSAGGEIYQYAL